MQIGICKASPRGEAVAAQPRLMRCVRQSVSIAPFVISTPFHLIRPSDSERSLVRLPLKGKAKSNPDL